MLGWTLKLKEVLNKQSQKSTLTLECYITLFPFGDSFYMSEERHDGVEEDGSNCGCVSV